LILRDLFSTIFLFLTLIFSNTWGTFLNTENTLLALPLFFKEFKTSKATNNPSPVVAIFQG
jgi:hypothetical protein